MICIYSYALYLQKPVFPCLDLSEASSEKRSFFNFSDTQDNPAAKLLYGSPRYHLYYGGVTITKTADMSNTDHKTLNGKTKDRNNKKLGFSSRFGQSVCFIDFNGDGRKEKVVGSPVYSKQLVSMNQLD